jgi:hypothetical protein
MLLYCVHCDSVLLGTGEVLRAYNCPALVCNFKPIPDLAQRFNLNFKEIHQNNSNNNSVTETTN